MGKQVLSLSPDPGVSTRPDESPCDFLLFDPERYSEGITHTQRLSPGSTLALDSKIEYQEQVTIGVMVIAAIVVLLMAITGVAWMIWG